LLGVINFSHGAVFALGAYLTWSFTTGTWGGGVLPAVEGAMTLSFLPAMTLSALLCGLLSVALERFAFAPLRRRNAEPLQYLVSSLGAGILLINVLLFVYGAETKNFDLETLDFVPPLVSWGDLFMRGIQLVILGFSLAILIAILLLFRFSLIGKALRAVAENPKAASLLGIPVGRMITLTFAVSGALASLAGTLIAAGFSIPGPHFGTLFGLKGLAVIVLGGMGDLTGALWGGLLLGIFEAAVPPEYSGYKEAVGFALLILVLLVRPQGLIGRKLQEKL
jgi:branched-chain amino acid transport system permease protein